MSEIQTANIVNISGYFTINTTPRQITCVGEDNPPNIGCEENGQVVNVSSTPITTPQFLQAPLMIIQKVMFYTMVFH